MGILNRMKNIVMARTNGILDQLEQPVDMLNHSIREAEEDLEKGQQALATQLYLEKKQAILLAQTKELAAKRERQAKLALERGEEDIAKIALQEKLIQEEKISMYEQQYEAIRIQTASLTDKLKQLNQKLDDYKHRRLLLISKLNVTSSLKQINESVVSFNTDHIGKGFARVEERILLLEAELEASQRLAPSNPVSSHQVDTVFKEKVEAELVKLKETI